MNSRREQGSVGQRMLQQPVPNNRHKKPNKGADYFSQIPYQGPFYMASPQNQRRIRPHDGLGID